MGCGERIVTVRQTTVVAPPAEMLQMESLEPPPNREEFVTMSPDRQLDAMMKSWNKLTVKLDIMNRRVFSIVEFVDKAEAYYEQKNKEELEKAK